LEVQTKVALVRVVGKSLVKRAVIGGYASCR